MADVILCYPKTRKYRDIRIIPYSLLYLAAFLLKRGFSVKIIDQRVDPSWETALVNELRGNPFCVGISSMSGGQLSYALTIARCVKKNSNVPVVWGGIHASLLPGLTIQNEYVDVVVRGEGEETLCELVEALADHRQLESIKGLTFINKNGTVVHTPDRAFIDLNTMPEIPYHLVTIGEYFINDWFGRSIGVLTSRGCPHDCSFCYNVAFNKRRWRAMSAERAVAEIKKVVELTGIHTLHLYEDNFFVDRTRVEKILDLVEQEQLQLTWWVECRVDYLKNMPLELLRKLKRLGLVCIMVGAEAASNEVLQALKKNYTIEDILSVNQRLKTVGITAEYSFIMATPSQTSTDFFTTVTLILRLLKENPEAMIRQINSFVPYPGTRDFETMKQNGFEPPERLEDWTGFTFYYARRSMSYSVRERRIMNTICVTSLFMKPLRKIISPVKYVAPFYYPFLRLRWKYRLFFPFIDTYLLNLVVEDRSQ